MYTKKGKGEQRMKKYARTYECGDHWLPLEDVRIRGKELYGPPIERLGMYEGLLDMEPAQAALRLRELRQYQQQIPAGELDHAAGLLKADQEENLLRLTYPYGRTIFIMDGEGFFQGKVDTLGGMVTDQDGNRVMLMLARYQMGDEVKKTPALKNRFGKDLFETWEEAEAATLKREAL